MRLVRVKTMGEEEDVKRELRHGWRIKVGLPNVRVRGKNGGGLCALQEWDSLKLSSHRRLQQLK